MLAMLVAAALSAASWGARAGTTAACSGVVKVSYGTYSHIVVTGLTCKYAKTFVVTSGGVPRGWKCTGQKTSSTTTIDKCTSGTTSLAYHFMTG